jgi:hypothetical protein
MTSRTYRRWRKVADAAALALVTALGIGAHALWPCLVGHDPCADVLPRALISFACAFAFIFVAVFSGRWSKGSLVVSPWFAWLVLGGIAVVVFGVVLVGRLEGGVVAVVVWTVVLFAVWRISRARGGESR